jgi:DNA polymerase III delta prime subunit
MSENLTLLEKYFPKDWEHLLLPIDIKNSLSKTREKKGYRLLLHSGPGTGKTTTSRLMNIGNFEILYLSGSNDFKIDTLRNKIMPFASGLSVLNKQKTVIIDEAERIRNDLQDSFKIILDQCKSINFIFITNNINDMVEPLLSRCEIIDYDFSGKNLEEQKKNFVNFALQICKEENIKYDNSGVGLLFKLFFPDFRHLLVVLDQLKKNNCDITEDNIKKLSETGKQILDLYEIIENPNLMGKNFYLKISYYKGKERECLISLGEPFFEYLNNKNLYEKTLDSAIIVSKYSNMFLTTINTFSTFLSCIVELKTLFR